MSLRISDKEDQVQIPYFGIDTKVLGCACDVINVQ